MSVPVAANQATDTSNGVNALCDEVEIFSSTLRVPGEMIRDVFYFCDVKTQFRLLMADKTLNRCLRKFCKRFSYQDFIKIAVFEWRRYVSLFEAYGELEVYFEDAVWGRGALDVIKRSNLTHLELSANFPIGAEHIPEFISQWASLPDSTLRNLQSLHVSFAESEDTFVQSLFRIVPQSLTRLMVQFQFQDPSVHLALVNRFQNLRSLSLLLDYFEGVALEGVAASVACALDLPFLEEFILDNDLSFQNIEKIVGDGDPILSHPFVAYFSDRGLQPRFDPAWVTWKYFTEMREPWNLLSYCINVNYAMDDQALLSRFVQLPRNNVGYSAILKQIDKATEGQAIAWNKALMSVGMDLRWERLETSPSVDPEFRWINVVLKYPDIKTVELLMFDKILPGPNETKITMIEGLAHKLGYVPFCKPLLAHLDNKKHVDLAKWLCNTRSIVSPLVLPALGFDRPAEV
eukprot:TRINITY_DN3261_c0_g1_i1.p1 TRINITY_DN3261_c0_g1~~TRINITY_DN3261_c0_g1_i1.p1  ORF type:complete len:461 (+),score=70.15 TRINITY_DN3261_c0_g1_i1:81-1463(+)